MTRSNNTAATRPLRVTARVAAVLLERVIVDQERDVVPCALITREHLADPSFERVASFRVIADLMLGESDKHVAPPAANRAGMGDIERRLVPARFVEVA